MKTVHLLTMSLISGIMCSYAAMCWRWS